MGIVLWVAVALLLVPILLHKPAPTLMSTRGQPGHAAALWSSQGGASLTRHARGGVAEPAVPPSGPSAGQLVCAELLPEGAPHRPSHSLTSSGHREALLQGAVAHGHLRREEGQALADGRELLWGTPELAGGAGTAWGERLCQGATRTSSLPPSAPLPPVAPAYCSISSSCEWWVPRSSLWLRCGVPAGVRWA